MITENPPKTAKKFTCDKCDYKSNKLSDYKNHLKTKKHGQSQNSDAGVFQNKRYICDCGKEYKYRQGLYTHRKSCDYINNENIIIQNENKDEMKNLKETADRKF